MAQTPAEILITNTLSGKKEKFLPKTPGQVRIYGCGPTVYGYIHVGNAMAALCFDLVTRILDLAGYKVEAARNYTDIDDKIIKVANENGISAQEVAEKFIKAYDADLGKLCCHIPKHRPKATESIQDIVRFVSALIENDLAYTAETPFGTDVYFRVSQFSEYGKLSKRNTEELEAGARIEVGEQKEDPKDFALWKAAKEGEPSWDSPWGAGRPGWHIECSAMIQKVFGDSPIDIHMGGLDLIFPHHENEIAQSEALLKHPLATYWVHNNLLHLGQEKMSKSLGNIVSAKDFLEAYGPEVLRLMVYQQHYRSPVDFEEENILRTESLLERMYLGKAQAMSGFAATPPTEIPPELKDLEGRMKSALFDDFNTAKALGVFMAAMRLCNRKSDPALWSLLGNGFRLLESIYGITTGMPTVALAEIRTRKLQRSKISESRAKEIETMLEKRTQLRKDKKFEESDLLRRELESQGILIMDTPDGSAWGVKVT